MHVIIIIKDRPNLRRGRQERQTEGETDRRDRQKETDRQGRHFNFFLGEGQNFFKFFNATGLLKNWKNSTLYVVI